MTTAKKARGGPLPALKRFVHSKHMVTLVWILGIVAVWEIFACIVAATKRTPVNVLPHLYEIIGSFFSDKKVTGKMTMIELIGAACGETLSRAGIGFLAGVAAGYILALVFGIGFQYAAIRGMEPKTPRGEIVRRAAKADILSLTAWQAGMYGWMAVVIFALNGGATLPRTSFQFWFMMQIAMACGFLAALPVNAGLIRAGIKKGM